MLGWPRLLSVIFYCCLYYAVSATELPTEVPSNIIKNVKGVKGIDGIGGLNSTIISYVCDDEILHNIERHLEHLLLTNEVMRSKLDLLKVKLDHQISEKNLLITSEFKKLKADLEPKPSEAVPPPTPAIPSNCGAAVRGSNRSGIYRIQPDPNTEPMFVWCELDPRGGDAWAVVQRRIDGSLDFYRKWRDYQEGFGNVAGEFFIGLENLHILTKSSLHELWVHLMDFDNVTRSANYDAFAIGSVNQGYALNVLGHYRGDAGDSMSYHQGMKFTTRDVHNDENRSNCALSYMGGWWYYKCHASNLNGQYLRGSYSKDQYGKGIDWNSWHGHTYSLKHVHMAIRPVK